MSLLRKIQIFSSNVAKLWTVDDANTARTTGTIVGAVQTVDQTGKVAPAGDAVGNAPFGKVTDGTNTLTLDNANTARTTSTKVIPTQVVDATGKISPAGDTISNSPFCKNTNYNSSGTELFTNVNPAIVDFSVDNTSPFGTLEVGQLTPVIQSDFIYGLNSQKWNTAVVSGTGATVDTNDGRLRIQSGTNNAGYAYVTSRRIARYRPGQGNICRFTPLFTTGVADNIQLFGVGSMVSNAPYDGYFVGYEGTAFKLFHYKAGSQLYAVAQNAWNGDKLDGTGLSGVTINFTYGTPWMIKYPFLGFGSIMYFVQNPSTSQWILVHTIQYANSTTAVQVTNPSLQLVGYTKNTGNTTNTIQYIGSMAIFISGVRSFVGNALWCADGSKSSITTETNLLSIKNTTTYNGVSNRGLIRLQSLSISTTGATATVVTVRFKIGATIGGVPAFTTINGTTADNGVTITSGNSIASYDTAGTTVTGGTYVYNISTSAGQNGSGGAFIDLIPYEIYISPTEILTISGASANNATIGISVNWSEDT